jgi:hypothetical protein
MRNGKDGDVRTPSDIRAEIDDLAERRTELWADLAGGNRAVRDEIVALTDRINELWIALRESDRLHRFGPREPIIRRAKAEERFERESTRGSRHRRPADLAGVSTGSER